MTRPVTIEPAASADEARALAAAFALAVTVATVTSPPKMLTVEISAEALAVAEAAGVANAPAVTEPALTIVPSAG